VLTVLQISNVCMRQSISSSDHNKNFFFCVSCEVTDVCHWWFTPRCYLL